MSYQPGRMGLAEGIGLAFVIMLPRVFLAFPANNLSVTKNIAWVAPLINWVVALAMFYLLAGVTARVKGDLYAVSERLLGKAGAWALALGYAVLFLLDAASLLRQYAESTLLTALPYAEFNIVIAWYTLVAAILVYLGIECIARTCYLLMPFVVAGVLAVIALLAPFYDAYRLLPWQGAGLMPAVQRGLLVTGVNLGGLLLFILAPQFQTAGTVKAAAVYGGTGSALLRSLVIFCFLLAFGVAEGMEKALPFYEMSRLVYLSRFIQRIESLFIVFWVFVGLLAIAIDIYVALYLVARPLGLPALRPLVPVFAFIAVGLAVIPSDLSTTIRLDEQIVSTLFTAGVIGGPALLWVAAFIRERRKQPWRA